MSNSAKLAVKLLLLLAGTYCLIHSIFWLYVGFSERLVTGTLPPLPAEALGYLAAAAVLCLVEWLIPLDIPRG